MRNGTVLLIMFVRLACDLVDKPMSKAQFGMDLPETRWNLADPDVTRGPKLDAA